MFDSLTDKLQNAFKNLARRSKLNEALVDEGLREVRLALLEADVHIDVVKDFIARVRARAVGAEVLRSLTPAQQVVKIVHEELLITLGESSELTLGGSQPDVIMLVGLQGSGKTTTAAKLAAHLRERGHRPYMVAADTQRPAAIEQLQTLGARLDIPVYDEGTESPPPKISKRGLKEARKAGADVVIIDTAGRLQIDDVLMDELASIRNGTKAAEVLLVADAMTGQEAVGIAQGFHERIGLSGLILTKIDGDARGGAAISMRAVTGVPIKLLGTGEKLEDLEIFHPDRLASRILGMGDIMTLIERAEAKLDIDEDEALDLQRKMQDATFSLEDFLKQLQMIKNMGPFSQILKMLPGANQLMRGVSDEDTERQLARVEAIINSMTIKERRRPEIFNSSRKRRVAKGSGTSTRDVDKLLRQFRQMKRVMKQMSQGGMPADLSEFLN